MNPAAERPRIDEAIIRLLPKAEVHVHLEGAFELADLLELARESQVPLPGPAATLFDLSTHHAADASESNAGEAAAPESAREFTSVAGTDRRVSPAPGPEALADTPTGTGVGSGGLSAFLRFLDWQCGLVRTADQAATVAYRFAARQSASGIRYTDVIINPTHWSTWRGRTDELVAAFTSGFDAAERDGLCIVNMALSLLRTQTESEAVELVTWIAETHPPRVVALSIDGDERVSGRTGPRFAAAFTLAQAAGIRRTVHAGESSGADGVWDALHLLHAERIDHGVHAIDDPSLVDHLATTGISLGICPRSNLTLGVYPDLAHHPLRDLQARGVRITINTDDPGAIGTRLENEWSLVADAFGWGLLELTELAQTSIDVSFAPDTLKAELTAELAATVAALGSTRS
ncbi:hypothetical protein GCM10022381_32130 [Leifsonia kafniensis]|uniref:Adenosine deaminase domain-containing protein n=1 Tax=Leifsonia kafniensis TaxID=475957 RepID=A0ABP7KWC1_9MICO